MSTNNRIPSIRNPRVLRHVRNTTDAPTIAEARQEDSFDESTIYFCHRCYQVKAGTAFLGRNTPNKTCDACCGRDTSRRVIPLDDMVFLDSLDEEYHGTNDEFHQPNDQGMYTFTCYVCIDPELELMGDRQVMDRILDVVGQYDGYRYVLRNKANPMQSFDISFTGYCSHSLTYQQNNPDRQHVRQHERMPVYDCHGRIQGIIKLQLRYVELEVRHESHPPADAIPTYPQCKYTTSGQEPLNASIACTLTSCYQQECWSSAELLGIVANVNGVVFPIAYFLYTKLEQNAPNGTKTKALKRFFVKLRDHRFVPTFMFSDKDKAQMRAIETVWGRNPIRLRLCLWHLK
ncbi:hypothetical protein INT45_006479 [Circinella minor]|uniref:MULE transposase domain-containing protein n=1 Tax=Circinella minor TaxID=1195481 RepID=A0A8H7VFS0_9FUNG|nr:hypothetical protein INT45_006479 [Circinella minor]